MWDIWSRQVYRFRICKVLMSRITSLYCTQVAWGESHIIQIHLFYFCQQFTTITECIFACVYVTCIFAHIILTRGQQSVQKLTKYFPSGETLQSWLDCLKTSEKFILTLKLYLYKESKALVTLKVCHRRKLCNFDVWTVDGVKTLPVTKLKTTDLQTHVQSYQITKNTEHWNQESYLTTAKSIRESCTQCFKSLKIKHVSFSLF